MRRSHGRPALTGFVYALLAYASWGLLPLYWKPFGMVSPLEVVSHRVIWSLLLLVALLIFGQLEETRSVLRNGKRLSVLFVTASLLGVNWALFIYGVVSGQVVQTSLGYFLNPLVSIFLVSFPEGKAQSRANLGRFSRCLRRGALWLVFGTITLDRPQPRVLLRPLRTFAQDRRDNAARWPSDRDRAHDSAGSRDNLEPLESGPGRIRYFGAPHASFRRRRSSDHIAFALVHQRNQTPEALHDGVPPIPGADFATPRRGNRV